MPSGGRAGHGRDGSGGCAFCDIVGGELPGHVVHEDDHFLAFLDRRPLFFGHCLVIPKAHYSTLAELPDELAGPLLSAVRLVARGVREALDSDGILVLNNNHVSQSVPHLHFHVIPRSYGDGLRWFLGPRHRYESEEAMARMRERIRAALMTRGAAPADEQG